jgi:putative flippase GtrA
MQTYERVAPVPTTEHQLPPITPTSREQNRFVATLKQLLRFGLVGSLNTMIDLAVLNCLLWVWPTHRNSVLLLDNSIAFSIGAINSFLLNKYWTFQQSGYPGAREITRFALTTLAALALNDSILWLISGLLHPVFLSAPLWANVSKLGAIAGTVLLSYLGMRLWVFVHASKEGDMSPSTDSHDSPEAPSGRSASHLLDDLFPLRLTTSSLSVVLPVYNEAEVITATTEQILRVLDVGVRDFEIILVNDGSTDQTGALLATLAASDSRIKVITHERNQGYGAALVDGFAAATKELTFFMDSDGQFDIRDLARLFPFIDEYDAVIGYRVNRQDTWLRKLNAWGWKMVIWLALGVHARDIDCAFKLLRTSFLREHPLETRGAMINAELLYKLYQAGGTYYEVGVQHFPRQSGRATGANLRVILRAFRELFFYARMWRREQKQRA